MTNFFSELANLGLKAANLQLVFGDNGEVTVILKPEVKVKDSSMQHLSPLVFRAESVELADSDFFEDADICIVATYTYGDGEMPFEFEDFFSDLKDEDLSGKIFGVVGSGDKDYGEFYCQSAKDFVEQFKLTGAKQGAELVCIEHNAEDEDIDLLQRFVEELVGNAE